MPCAATRFLWTPAVRPSISRTRSRWNSKDNDWHGAESRRSDGSDRADQHRRGFHLRAAAGGAGARPRAVLLHARPPLAARRATSSPMCSRCTCRTSPATTRRSARRRGAICAISTSCCCVRTRRSISPTSPRRISWSGSRRTRSSSTIPPPCATRRKRCMVMEFAELMPPTLITRDRAEIEAFRARFEAVVMKPLYGHGGAAVFRLARKDANFGSLFDLFATTFREPWVVQEFLPAVAQGDKRIILVEGERAGRRQPRAAGRRHPLQHGARRPRRSLAADAAASRRSATRIGPELQAARPDLRRHRRDRRPHHRDQRDLADGLAGDQAARRPRSRRGDLGRDRGAPRGLAMSAVTRTRAAAPAQGRAAGRRRRAGREAARGDRRGERREAGRRHRRVSPSRRRAFSATFSRARRDEARARLESGGRGLACAEELSRIEDLVMRALHESAGERGSAAAKTAAARHRRRRRLRPRHAGAALRHRPAVSRRRPARPEGQAHRRDAALCAVGPEAEGRPRDALGRRLHRAGARGHDDPHLDPGSAAAQRRRQAVRDAAPPLRHRRSSPRPPASSSPPSSPSATSASSARANRAISSSPTSRRARAAYAISTRCSGSPNMSIASQDAAELVGAGLFTAEELRLFRRCEEFLWAVRCHLHFLTEPRRRSG